MKMTPIIILLIIVVVGFFVFTLSNKQTNESGSVEINAPSAAKTNDPILIEIVLSAPKSDAFINTRFTDISLYYKLTAEKTYSMVKPFQASLSEKYQNTKNDRDYEQYNYFLPLYPAGTRGEIEYYVDVMFDGKLIHSEGTKKITLID